MKADLYLKVVLMVIAVCLVINCVAIGEETKDGITINIKEGKINGKPFGSITNDWITDVLGKPSRTFSIGGSGKLAYEHLGLLFELGRDQSLYSLTIYMEPFKQRSFTSIRARATVPSMNYSAFRGTIAEGITDRSKDKKIFEIFGEPTNTVITQI